MAKGRRSREKAGDAGKDEVQPKSLQDMRKAHIQRVIVLSGGNMEEAARLLEISVSDLHRWMKKLKI
jgi:ActR/RegA family two-component response regulator